MRWQRLDSIVRSVLLQEGKPVHWYLQYLKYACDGLRELNFDTLKMVNVKELPVNSYKAIPQPCDYVDFVRVGTSVGQYVKPMVQGSRMNRLNKFDNTGSKVPYETAVFDEGYWWWGMGHGRSSAQFQPVNERNEIQLDAWFPGDFAVLEYITDGQEMDAATKVHPYAQATIEAIIRWKREVNKRGGQPAYFEDQVNKEARKLRGRVSNLTLVDIQNIFFGAYSHTYR